MSATRATRFHVVSRLAVATVEMAGRTSIAAQAAREGLPLEPTDTLSGYKGVKYDKRCKSKPYEAQINQGGKQKSLGRFVTAEEAALAFARANKERKIAAGKPLHAPKPLTKAEAVRLASEEGLTLERAGTTGGYKGVKYNKRCKSKPYEAQIRQGRGVKALRNFAKAEEAALAFARADKERKIAAGKPLQPPKPLTKAEAVRLAREEGLTLELADTSGGYKGVYYYDHLISKPYEAQISRRQEEEPRQFCHSGEPRSCTREPT